MPLSCSSELLMKSGQSCPLGCPQRWLPCVCLNNANGALLNQQPQCDKLLNSEVAVQSGDNMSVGIVKRRAIGPDGAIVGTYDNDLAMNSIVCEVEFLD